MSHYDFDLFTIGIGSGGTRASRIAANHGAKVAAAVALENLAIFDEEGLNQHVQENSPLFRAELEKLLDLPLVG